MRHVTVGGHYRIPDGEEDANHDGVRDQSGGQWTETDPLDPDSDSDGLRDGQETAGWQVGIWYEATMEKKTDYHVTSDPLLANSDGDDLNDFSEFLNGSDPRSVDTDGDGIDDHVEVEGGYNVTGIEGTPPRIERVEINVIPDLHFELAWTPVSDRTRIDVAFDIFDNVGVDRIQVSILKGGTGTLLSMLGGRDPWERDMINKGGGTGYAITHTFAFSLWGAAAEGADINITAWDMNGNAAWGQFHVESVAEKIAKAIVAFFEAVAKVIVEALSFLADLIIALMQAGVEAIMNGIRMIAEPLIGGFFDALAVATGHRGLEGLQTVAMIAVLLIAFNRLVDLFLLAEALEAVFTSILAVMTGGTIALLKAASAKTIKDVIVNSVLGMVAVATGLAFLETLGEHADPEMFNSTLGQLFHFEMGIILLLGAFFELGKILKQTGDLRAKAAAAALALVGLAIGLLAGVFQKARGIPVTGWIALLVDGVAFLLAFLAVCLLSKGKRSPFTQIRMLFVSMTDSVEDAITVVSLFDTGATLFYGGVSGKYA